MDCALVAVAPVGETTHEPPIPVAPECVEQSQGSIVLGVAGGRRKQTELC